MESLVVLADRERAVCRGCGSSDVVLAAYSDFEGRWDGVDQEWMPVPVVVPAVRCLDCEETHDV